MFLNQRFGTLSIYSVLFPAYRQLPCSLDGAPTGAASRERVYYEHHRPPLSHQLVCWLVLCISCSLSLAAAPPTTIVYNWILRNPFFFFPFLIVVDCSITKQAPTHPWHFSWKGRINSFSRSCAVSGASLTLIPEFPRSAREGGIHLQFSKVCMVRIVLLSLLFFDFWSYTLYKWTISRCNRL